MIAAKTGMQSAYFLERVDHRCRRKGVRRQPAARIRKQTSNSRQHHADRDETYDETGLRQIREGRLIRFGRVHFTRYLILVDGIDGRFGKLGRSVPPLEDGSVSSFSSTQSLRARLLPWRRRIAATCSIETSLISIETQDASLRLLADQPL